MNRSFNRLLSILLTLAVLLSLFTAIAATASADKRDKDFPTDELACTADFPYAETESFQPFSITDDNVKPTQSDTEFVVALSPEFAGKVLRGEAELFRLREEDGYIPDSAYKADAVIKQTRELPPGLLKKSSDAIDIHRKDLERYAEKQPVDDPVLLIAEAENAGVIQEARAAVEMCEGVLYTDPLTYYYADGFTDPRASEQWGLIPIDAYNAWNGNSGLSDIVIAILDTGVWLTHEDLAASIVPGWDFIGNDSDPTDENGHGTHVAGIAAAINNNGKGISSPAGGAKIMPVRVLNASGSGDVLSISDGIRFAADHGADFINMSLGGTGQTMTMRLAVEYALAKGCLIVGSAGNNNSNLPNYPAAYDGVIIAASLSVSPNPDYPYAESYFSNYNADLAYRTIHAPGEKILSTYYRYDSSYMYLSGTSMSAPYVCGIAAAIKARGGYSDSLFNAVLAASERVPRALLNSAGEFWSVSGEMNALVFSGKLVLPDFIGRLTLSINPRPANSRIVQACVEARTKTGAIDTSANGFVEVSFKLNAGFWLPKFGEPRYTTFTQQVELTNGIGYTNIDMAGYNNNNNIDFWASDPSWRYGMSEKVAVQLYNSVDFRGCNINIKLDKPDSYTGPASLPTGKESFELQIYFSYYDTLDSNEPPSGMSSAGASSGRLKWNPESLQYEGTISLTRGKVQLYYYVYNNGSDKRYPNPQPIGGPILLMGDVSVRGELRPYEHVISFASGGGSPEPANQLLPYGGLVTWPGTISRTGYTFGGWYTSPEFSGMPYDFMTPIVSSMTLYAKWENKQPCCRIGSTAYQTLEDALTASKSGDVITLLYNIVHNETINITGKAITFDLSGNILDVIFTQQSPYAINAALYVKDGELRIVGGGELNVKSMASGGAGLLAVNSTVEITNAVGAKNSTGIRAEDESKVVVHGNARGMYGVNAVRGSFVTVYGDAIGLANPAGNRSTGVSVTANSEAVIFGDVVADDAVRVSDSSVTVYGNVYGGETYYSSGVEILGGGSVTVNGNVTTAMSGVVTRSSGTKSANVEIHGNIICTRVSSVGVEMGNNGYATVTVDGTISAPIFAEIFNVAVKISDTTTPTTKQGYLTYSGTKSNAAATLWVKEPVIVYHAVNFAANGGSPAPSAQSVVSGGTVEQPAPMTRDGYDFDGWYTDADFSGSPYTFWTAVNSSLTLYAKWTVSVSYGEVRGDVNGDGVIDSADQTLMNMYFAQNVPEEAVFIFANADVNSDDVVNRADQTRMNQYFSGVDPRPFYNAITPKGFGTGIILEKSGYAAFASKSQYASASVLSDIQQTEQPEIRVSSMADNPGEVTLEASFVNNPGLSSYGIRMRFDTDKLTCVSYAAGDLLTDGFYAARILQNEIFFSSYDIMGLYESGTVLFTVTFSVNDNSCSSFVLEDDAVYFIFENPVLDGFEVPINGGTVIYPDIFQSVIEVKASLEHTKVVYSKAATCVEDGYERICCAVCGAVISEVIIPAAGHDYWWEVDKEATCEQDGIRVCKCSKCDDIAEREVIPALGHDWNDGDVTLKPTETEEGEKIFTCRRCGKTRTEVIPPVPPDCHEHSYTSTITDPTCTMQGYTLNVCSCGDSYICEYTNAYGHDWDKGTVTTPATSESEGTKTYTCRRCGDTRTESIAKLSGGVISDFSSGEHSSESSIPDESDDIVDFEEDDVPLGEAMQTEPHCFSAFINGYPDNTYHGTDDISREEFVNILYKLKSNQEPPKADTASPSFLDVDASRWSYDAIEWAAAAGIIVNADGLFRPKDALTRAELAVMLANIEGWTEVAEDTFNDLEGHDNFVEILKAVYAGIFEGYPDGSFRPDGTATRYELVAVMIRYLLGGEPETEMWEYIEVSFSDIPSDNWAYKYVALATVGYEAVSDTPGAETELVR